MPGVDQRQAARDAVRTYEEKLPVEHRKRLGQFFTGLPLGKLLAHLALDTCTKTLLDPMAGHGDLLDATLEAANEIGISIERLDGIEIDRPTAEACRTRLSNIIINSKLPYQKIIAADAFDPLSVLELPQRLYDLVITNPPYVRYQIRNANGGNGDQIRKGLAQIANIVPTDPSSDIWHTLIDGYSGLADLSVPAWLQAALLVQPKGRLALVIPATWRSRNYADVIRYLLLRCFKLEYVVEDTQPGWFSNALVRTHLIVAQRLIPDEAVVPLVHRDIWPTVQWLKVAPEASNGLSLVGTAFEGQYPEAQFAAWVRDNSPIPKTGIHVRTLSQYDEWRALASRIRHHRWYRTLESVADGLPLFAGVKQLYQTPIPAVLRDILPTALSSDTLCTLEKVGIDVGQGLRTGCNRFFYVTECGPSDTEFVFVEASPFFNHHRFVVPKGAVLPVLRRQSEVGDFEAGRLPHGRVLYLRNWVLPEDYEMVSRAREAYIATSDTPPEIMPDELASFVRMAAYTPLNVIGERKYIPELSAVRTNVRVARKSHVTPRFWYMLPDFTSRHLPAAFVPRLNNGLPWVESNYDPAILVDANFSTFWAINSDWTHYSLKALLNSTWCRAFMEALGTPLGGGALKLEATHLRQLLVPVVSDEVKSKLDKAGKKLGRNAPDILAWIDEMVMGAVLGPLRSNIPLTQINKAISDHAHRMSKDRQRAA